MAERPTTPSIAGLVAISLVVSAGALVLLPGPGSYGIIALCTLLIGLGLLDARRRRRGG